MAKSKTDKHLLDQLMFSLYPEPKTIYREYIQNATDSILEAELSGVLEPNEGHITVDVNDNKQEIKIWDNGKGLSQNEAETILKDISVSTKRDKDYTAGYFGIGKFVGAGYCQQMTFRTTTKGENVISELIFDVTKIRQILDDSSINMSPNEVIDTCTTFNTIKKEKKDEHFFEVVLSQIKPEYVNLLLSEELIKDYLVQIAPIDFKAPFKTSLFFSSLDKNHDKIKSIVKNLRFVKLTLNKNVDIRKDYGLKVEGTEDKIKEIRFFMIDDPKFGDLAWGWYAVTPFSTQISETNTSSLTRGLRLRIKNIQIGSESFFDGTEYFKEPRGNKFFNGEIHVLNKNIKPTSDRSDIQPTTEGQLLKKKIHEFCITELGPVYRNANAAKTAIQNFEKSVQELSKIQEKSITADYTKEDKEKEISTAQKKKEKILDDLQKRVIDKEGKTEGEKAVLKIYKEKAKELSTQPINEPEKPYLTPEKTENTSSIKIEECKNEKDDIFAGLRSKYNEDEMKIIEKIFEIIDVNFYTDAYKRVVNPVKRKILSELNK